VQPSPDQLAIIRRNLQDPVRFLRLYLEEWFPDTIPWVHRGIIAIICRRCEFLPAYGEMDKIIEHFVWRKDPFDPNSPAFPIFYWEDGKLRMTISRYTATMMPRGFAKTTLLNGINIYKIVHMLTKFTLYVSESSPHAATQLGNVKDELESNELILKTYGELRGEKWTNDDIETSTKIKVVARGRNGQIRGLLRRGARPDNVTVDDIEDEESVQTDDQRAKTRRWGYRSLMPVLPRRDLNASINFLGTMLHADAFLMTLAKDPRFNFIRFSAYDNAGEPLWPQHMGVAALDQEKAAAALAGDLAGYYMEFESKLSDEKTAKFKNFIYGAVPSGEEHLVATALAVDPAISNKAGADFFAIAAVGMTNRGRHFVLECEGDKGVTPRAQVDLVFEMYKKIQYLTGIRPKVGIEAVAYQQALVHLVREEMFRKKTYFEIEEIRHGNVAKERRVEGVLQPRYANGYVVHTKVFPGLEVQLKDWPNNKKDFPDAVAMAVTLLDPWASAAAPEGHDLEDDVYAEDKEDCEIRGAP